MKNQKGLFAKIFSLLVLIFMVGCGQKKDTIENYPNKPVEIIVGFSAGGGTDSCARLVFEYAGKYFGQNFAIVNKPGASGEIAWTELAGAEPDGYTIGFINPPTFVSHPVQRDTCKYDMDSFKIIANMVTDPACIVVRAADNITTVKKLYDSNATIGYSGPGTSESLMLRQIEEIIGKSIDKIPYDGSAPSVVALLGKHIDAVCMNVSEAINHTSDGTLKVIGISSRKKVKAYPNVDTLSEQGIEVYNEAYRGVAAPAGVPDEIIAKIEASIKKALEDPEFQEKAKKQNLPLDYLNSADFTKVILDIKADLEKETEKGEW